MKKLIGWIAIILIIIAWNYFPYSENCWEYPLTGCDYNDFWWNLPSGSDYRGISWGAYFGVNIFLTILILVVYGKIVSDE